MGAKDLLRRRLVYVDMSPDNGNDADVDIRDESQSGWLKLTKSRTSPQLVDALLASPPGREFNKTELGNQADVSRESVRDHIETLLMFGIVEEVPDSEPTRYRLNDRGKVTRELFELNSALNAVGGGADPNIEIESEDEEREEVIQFDQPDDGPDLGAQLREKLSS